MALFLKETGYTVYVANSPSKALELANNLSIRLDLVITDFVMPEMNGQVLMKRIRELRPQLQCVYASGHSVEETLLTEEAHFIKKPYDLIMLSGYLQRFFRESEEPLS